MSSSSEKKVLSSFKNCLIRIILASNKGLKKTGRSPIRMRLLFQMILFLFFWDKNVVLFVHRGNFPGFSMTCLHFPGFPGLYFTWLEIPWLSYHFWLKKRKLSCCTYFISYFCCTVHNNVKSPNLSFNDNISAQIRTFHSRFSINVKPFVYI